MEITPQALEIVTGRSERLNNRAANAYVISGKGFYPPVEAPPMKELISLSVLGRQSKLMRFGHRPVALCCKTRNCAWPVFNFLPPRMVAVYLI